MLFMDDILFFLGFKGACSVSSTEFVCKIREFGAFVTDSMLLIIISIILIPIIYKYCRSSIFEWLDMFGITKGESKKE